MPQKTEKKNVSPEVQLVVFKLRDEEFGVDISQVREIVRIPEITKIPEAPGFIEGVINLRGEVIAVIDLAREFELSKLEEKLKSGRIIVVEVEGKTFGIIVDEVPEVLKLAEENVEPAPELIQSKINKDFIKGVGKIGDRLLIIIDINKVLVPLELEQTEKISKEG